MKYSVILVALLSGCSTLGEVEALNDVGLGQPREAISVFHKTLNVLGYQSKTRSASTYNNFYGHLKNINTDKNNIPYIVRDIKEVDRYISAIRK